MNHLLPQPLEYQHYRSEAPHPAENHYVLKMNLANCYLEGVKDCILQFKNGFEGKRLRTLG